MSVILASIIPSINMQKINLILQNFPRETSRKKIDISVKKQVFSASHCPLSNLNLN